MSTVLSPVCRAPANPTYGKIQSSHLQRQAVVYVRQSTLQQVERHRSRPGCSTPWWIGRWSWAGPPRKSS
jgi:hypothetical protein